MELLKKTYGGSGGGKGSGLDLDELRPPSAREVLAAAERQQAEAKKAAKVAKQKPVDYDPCVCW